MKRKHFQNKATPYMINKQDKGIVLIATLALIAIITLISTTAFYTTNTDIKISGNYKTSTQAFYFAEAGIHDGIGRLMLGDISDSGAKEDPNWNTASTYSSSGLNNSFTVTHHVIGGSVVTDDSGTPLFLISSTGTSSASTKQIETVVRLIYALPFTMALAGCDGVTIESNVFTDSYNSSLGSYASQVIPSGTRKDAQNNPWARDRGNVSTANADTDVIIDGNAQIHGSAKATRYVGISGIGIPTTGLGTPDNLTGYKGSPDTNSSNAIIYGSPTENNPTTPCDPLDTPTIFTTADDIVTTNNNAGLSNPPYNPGSKAFDLDSNDSFTLGIAGQIRNYHFTSFNLDSNSILTINGEVTCYVSGNFNLSSNAKITLTSGSKLAIFVTGTIDFNSNIVTNPNEPMDFTIYSSATSSSNTNYKVNLDSNTELVGTIYAPYAAINLSSNSISSGAIRGKYIKAGSNAKFHYDEALGKLDGYPITGFEIISWREIN
ncbi:MAG: hypothetical protein F9K48_00560 [Candidatus Brocadia sp.]|nr:MAG: hypothetical protein F9K48_00560 [Candidatus Brocadia sp.]